MLKDIKQKYIDNKDFLNQINILGSEILTKKGIDTSNYNLSNIINEIPNFTYDDGTNLKFINNIISNGFNDTSITIPKGITSIGPYIFYGCSKLQNINLPDNLIKIGDFAFYNTKISTFTIPNSVEHLGKGCFASTHRNQTEIKISENNKNYLNDSYGIVYNKDKTTLVACPNTAGLSEIVYIIPETTLKIEDYAFYYSDIGEVVLNNLITSIGENTFRSSKIRSITLSNILESIGENAFYNCSNLINIIIPNSVKSIGEDAFYYCSNLTDIIIGESITEFPTNIFSNCSKLSNITILGDIKNLNKNHFYGTAFYENINNWTEDGVLYLNNTLISTDKTQGGTLNIREGTKRIAEDAFDNWSSIKPEIINLPESIKTIEKNTFRDFSDLTTINLENVEYIGGMAFKDCSNLKSINLNSIKELGESAFQSCNSLTSITIPGTLEKIKDSTFCDCYSLENLIIENGVKEIEKNAFSDTNIKTLILPDSIEEIKDYAFNNIMNLTNVTIGNGIKNIGYMSFGSNLNLSKVTISGKPEYIDPIAFILTPNLKTINVSWSKDEVPGAPWGATTATIYYNK